MFCGTPDAAVPSLRALLDDHAFDVRLVVAQPDRPSGRGHVLTPPPVKTLATERGIRLLQHEKLNAAFADIQASLTERPDFLVVVAYGQILSEAVLAWPTIAPVNVHFSLLPRWRGAAPVEFAILQGDAETGVAVQVMERGLDTGPLLAVERTPIGVAETTTQLRARLAVSGAILLRETLKNPLLPIEQSTDGVTLSRKLTKEDGEMNTSTHTAIAIDRAVRALTPRPGVTLDVSGERVKILETSMEAADGSFAVACAQGTTLHVMTVVPPGKKPMKAADWQRGLRKT